MAEKTSVEATPAEASAAGGGALAAALAPDVLNATFPQPQMRPAALFQLAGADGGGRFVLPDVALRKVVKRAIFENFDDTAYNVKPPTQMLRFIDALRYHKPTDEERQALNLNSATERIYLHDLNDILMMCGARKGARFSSQDVNRLRRIAESLEARYKTVDSTFRSLPSEVVRYRFASVKRLEEDASNFAFLGHRRRSSLVGMETLSAEDAIRRQAFHFQWLARQYVVAFGLLRDAMLEIYARVQEDMASAADLAEPTLADINDAVEAEFEAKTHRPFPSFLLVLIQKYHRERHHERTPWAAASEDPPVDSIAQFALYLSGVLLQPAPLTVQELLSAQVLLQVVKAEFRVDRHAMVLEVLRVVQADGQVLANCSAWSHGDESGAQNGVRVLTHGTLSELLFAFLATVRELRLVPRQKELLVRRKRSRKAPPTRSQAEHEAA